MKNSDEIILEELWYGTNTIDPYQIYAKEGF
jgi:hypothetical protein